MRIRSALGVLCALALSLSLAPERASACGGCFAPSGQAAPVVAHRMALMIAADRTTLWDQFEYRGAPEEFAWVLPVRGTDDVVVELSDNTFFESLVQATTIQLQGPSMGGGGTGGIGCGAASAASPSFEDGGGVTVYSEQVVGPYETTVIGSEDPGALLTWLQDSGYYVADELLPVIDWYVARGMNFLALRLAPGEGVSRIQPVRVTTPGALGALPLRMIAAGVTDHVALELFVFADQRYETGNFANVEVDRDEVVYQLDTSTYNYDRLAAEALLTDGGSAWLTEVAARAPNLTYYPVVDESTGETLVPTDDWEFITAALPSPYLTRLRADLPVNALGDDLVLRRSDGPDLYSFINVTRSVRRTRAGVLELREGDTRFAGAPAPIMAAVMLVGGLGAHLLRRRRRR